MRSFSARALLFCAVVALVVVNAEAIRQPRLELDQIARRASAVVVTTVLVAKPFVDPATDAIWTEYRLRVHETWRGAMPLSEMRVRFYGGAVDGRSEGIAGLPRLETGRMYLLFLDDARGPVPTVGAAQGIFRVVHVPSGMRLISGDGELLEVRGERMLVRSGPWVVHDDGTLEAVSPSQRREKDPDPALSTGWAAGPPAAARSTSAAATRPATLDDVKHFLFGTAK